MVSLPIFGEGVGVPFPRFNIARAEDETAEEFVVTVKEGACDILGKMSDKEYLARQALTGTMP